MRNLNRLYDFYRELQEIHLTYFPDWRFSQFVCNFQTWLANDKKIYDMFYIEEIPMMNLFREFTEKYSNK